MIAALRISLVVLLLSPSLSMSQTPESEFDADIRRYLSVTKFSPSFKQGIRTAIASQGHSNDLLDQALALSDAEIISAVVPIFSEQLTAKEAKEIADFYSSETGREILNQQFTNLGNPNPPIRLTSAQRSEYERFVMSVGGLATKRLDALQHTDAYWQRVNQAVAAAIRD